MALSSIGGEDYVRCRVLGKGSFGKVYAMQHVTTESYRVVKEMHKGTILSKGNNVIDLLLNERKILSELKGCPFVVKCFASCQDDKFLYMLLEFCSGGELEYHLKAVGKFEEETVKSYIAQIAVALEHMHIKYNVVHRDLKPENILLDEKGFCAIIDFNMAIKCNENLVVPNPNHFVVGTLPYIAPELLSGKDHSDKVDWWSLGVIAYELSHGRHPFRSRDGADSDKKKMLNIIKTTKLKDVLSSSCSEDLKSLISGLLEMEPENRFGAEEIKKHKFFEGMDWDSLIKKQVKPPLIPDANTVNFKPDANVEEVFGLSKPKENLNVPLTMEQQEHFEGWDWIAEDQELPEPDPVKVQKLIKKKKKKPDYAKDRKSGKLTPKTTTKKGNTTDRSLQDEGSHDKQ